MKVSKLLQLKKKQKIEEKKLECILYIEMNKKVSHTIIQIIDIKNVTRSFFN